MTRKSTAETLLAQDAKAMRKQLARGTPLKSYQRLALEQAALFQRLPDGAAKATLAMERFGKSGQDMIPILSRGPDGRAKTWSTGHLRYCA